MLQVIIMFELTKALLPTTKQNHYHQVKCSMLILLKNARLSKLREQNFVIYLRIEFYHQRAPRLRILSQSRLGFYTEHFSGKLYHSKHVVVC